MDALAGFWLSLEYLDLGDNMSGVPRLMTEIDRQSIHG